jgi:hypothetical protein
MITLSLEAINSHSPYRVVVNNGDYDFITKDGIRYSASFLEDIPLGDCDTYQFGFRKKEEAHTNYDANVKTTLLAIINQFFIENENVLLYICDTSDGREAKRNRLFLRWFEEFANPECFTMRSANAIVERQGFYAAIIVENSNPKLEAIISDFNRSAESLTAGKP